jgi:DNA-binding MarR family transcriptional regulator
MPKKMEPAPLTAHVGYWLRFVSNHVSQSFAHRLEAKGVSVPEWAIMRELYDAEHVLPSVLAERIGVTRGAISKIVDRLAAKKLAVRSKPAGDGRTQAVRLTPSGRRLVPDLAAIADANDASFFDHLEPEQHAEIIQALRSVVERHGLKGIPIQ